MIPNEKLYKGHDHPDHPGKPDHPDHPGKPGHPDHPGKPDHPDHPGKPDHPDHPGKPDHPDHPGKPDHPDHPEKPDMPITIIVNAEDKTLSVGTKQLSYEDVVMLAYGNYDSSSNVIYTVSYSNGPEQNRKGNLVKGQSAWVQEGMIFNVSRSDKS